MKKIRLIAMFLLMTFLTAMISPNFAYATEDGKKETSTETKVELESEFIKNEKLILAEYNRIINNRVFG